MFWLPNTINVYKCAVAFGLRGLGGGILTAHCVPTVPGSSDDNCTQAALWASFTWGNSWRHLTFLNPSTSTEAIAEACRINADSPHVYDVTLPGGSPDPAPHEAAALIRRVGAGPFGPVSGRCRIGPIWHDLFTDAPRYRKINNLDVRITDVLTLLTSTQAFNLIGMTEVLWNRRTAVATRVDTYTCPTRVGRVWQRAGYPQGVRGPARGGHGYGKKRNYP